MSINYTSQFGFNPFTSNGSVIQGYHRGGMRITKIGNRKPNRHGNVIHMGVELEVDGFPTYEAKEKCALEIFRLVNSPSKQVMKFENDASLSNGFEMITQPIIRRRHEKSVPWAEIMNIVKRHGGRSHDGGCCGLHVHVEKESEEFTRNLWLLVNNVYRLELKGFSRRENFRYCEFDSDRDYNYRTTGHFCAFNTSPSTGCTVEFRFIRGTLKPETFYESLRLIEKLCWLARGEVPVSSPRFQKPKFTSLLSEYGKQYYSAISRRSGGAQE